MKSRAEQRGFTLLELLVAMAIMAMMSVAIYGVVSIGGRAAASGERKTEQARRLRIAADLMVRQLRSTVPMSIFVDGESRKFFIGEPDRVTFVTDAPQLPDASGLSLVSYWQEGDRLMYSEVPRFAVIDAADLDEITQDLSLTTTLLYNVRRVEFRYRRNADSDAKFEKNWDADELDDLPAAVEITVTPATPDGPDWQHQVPVFVGVFNEISGEDDFSRRRVPSSGGNRVPSSGGGGSSPSGGGGSSPFGGSGRLGP